MKNNKVKYLVLALLFVGVFAVAMIAYSALSESYTPIQNGGLSRPETGSSDASENPEVETPETTPEEEPEDVFAPDFTVLDADGNEVTLQEKLADGKPVVLNFWATWCGPCKSELPAFDKASAEYADRVTFMFLNLTDGHQETIDGVKAFMEENGYTFPVYFDTEYSAAIPYGANSIPLTYFVTSDGVVVGGYMGAMSEDILYDYLGQLLDLENEGER